MSNIAANTDRKTYVAWVNMRQRCNNTHRPDYSNYGGRGITVCSRWDSYDNFLADMGTAPAGMSLERKDNNKGYFKNNCVWATATEQVYNRRDRSVETHLRPTNTTGISGVYWAGIKGKWQVKVPHKRTMTFSSLLDACSYKLSPYQGRRVTDLVKIQLALAKQ